VGGMKMGEVHRNFTHKKKKKNSKNNGESSKNLVSSDYQTTR